MQSVVFAMLAIVFGLLACFAGYQLFRTLLPILAGLYGYAVASSWFGPDQWLAALVVGLGLLVLFAILAYAFWSVTVGTGGALLGYGVGVQLATFLGFGGFLATISGFVLAFIFGVMFFSARDVLVMLSTALSGAGLALTGLALLLPTLLGWLANESNFITFILTIVLATLGFGAQYRTAVGQNVYGGMRL
jgi:hypothetical protein